MPLISVIIPVYNAAALIDRSLDSIFNQLGGYDIEVLLIDDGSTDSSVELIKRRKEQDRIHLFHQENAGPSKARNKGIAEARGKYLAFLDADDYWLPGFLKKTASFLDTHDDIIAVSVAQRHLTTTGIHDSPACWALLAPRDGIVLNDFLDFWSRNNHICTGSILIRTDVAKETQGMRADLRVCEDLEYWGYLSTFGKIGYIPEILFVSDGTKVTQNIGWVTKHLPRWRAAMPIEDWQKRIVARNDEFLKDVNFIKMRGRIAQNLAYSILLSKRYELAKTQIKKYGDSFPIGKMRNLLLLAVKNSFNWFIVSRFLVYREYHRK